MPNEGTPLVEPKVRHKTFSYRTALEWAGNRAGILTAEGKLSFRVASPPELKGNRGCGLPRISSSRR